MYKYRNVSKSGFWNASENYRNTVIGPKQKSQLDLKRETEGERDCLRATLEISVGHEEAYKTDKQASCGL